MLLGDKTLKKCLFRVALQRFRWVQRVCADNSSGLINLPSDHPSFLERKIGQAIGIYAKKRKKTVKINLRSESLLLNGEKWATTLLKVALF